MFIVNKIEKFTNIHKVTLMQIENQLTLKQLRAFVAVYRRGKLASAAEEIGVTPSAVSVLIRQAEDALSIRLFDRTTRSLVPTQAAEEAFGIAERILQDVKMLGSSFRELTDGRRGRVRVAATPATAAALLPLTARRFARTYANIGLVIDDCAPNQFLPHIQSERVDLGIGTPPPGGSDFNVRTLLEDQMQLVCAQDHRLASNEAVRWVDLKGEPLIVFRPGYGVRQLIDTMLLKVGLEPAVVQEVGFLSTAAWMTASGLGVTILPSALARLESQRGLVLRPLIEPAVTRTIALVTKKGRSLPPSCHLFIDMLMEDLRQSVETWHYVGDAQQ